MKTHKASLFRQIGGVSFLAGAAMAASFIPLTRLPSLRGGAVISFLSYFLIAAAAYLVVLARLKKDRLPTWGVWGFAILLRVILLFTSPTLSDDVYRNVWDGHLLSQGVNPYALPVNAPELEPLNITARGLVNHNWMASPYLPAAQLYFALVTRIAPESILAFQIGAVILDLAVGLLLAGLMKKLRIRPQGILLYLWNPLVLVEFVHGAHIDALMLFFTLLAFSFLFHKAAGENKLDWPVIASALSLAAATLTKGIPLLLAPLFFRKWGWKGAAVFTAATLGPILLFVPGAGWGLTGPLDGTGVFGALRIYTRYWNYNSAIYHWLETWLSGYSTSGAVPLEIVGEGLLNTIRAITGGITLLSALLAGWLAWQRDKERQQNDTQNHLTMLRLAILPLGAFLLFTPTLNPWYLGMILMFLPFLLQAGEEKRAFSHFLWPWICFSLAVPFSYLTYIDPQDFREFRLVRLVEYAPFYLLLAWAAGYALYRSRKPAK